VAPVTGGPIGDAAAKFSEATYPLAAKIDWGNTQQITKHPWGNTEVDGSEIPFPTTVWMVFQPCK